MPATYAIATIHPAPGHEMEALSNVRDVKSHHCETRSDDPKWRAIGDKARPPVIGRRWLTEVL